MKDTFLTRILICMGLLFSTCLLADDDNLEYKIKAGYLYNFTKFVTWPTISGATFNLCILGNDPFGTVIDPIEKKSAFSRSIKIIRLNEVDFLSGSNCHILYISGTTNPKMVFKKTHSLPKQNEPLTVGENEAFIAEGGMIGFVNRAGKIKLQINLQSVKQTDLRISAKLLEIAEHIQEARHD